MVILPLPDLSVILPMGQANTNLVNYLKPLQGISLVFHIEYLRNHIITTTPRHRHDYLLYTLDMYKD